jgi:hypothetical protein
MANAVSRQRIAVTATADVLSQSRHGWDQTLDLFDAISRYERAPARARRLDRVVAAYHGLARHWAHAGRLSEAVEHQREAVRVAATALSDGSAIASEHVYLGQLLLRQQTADAVMGATAADHHAEPTGSSSSSEAEAELRMAIALAPDHPNAHEALLCCEFDRELQRIWTGREELRPSMLQQAHAALQRVMARAEERRAAAPALCGGDLHLPRVAPAGLRAASRRAWQDAGQCCAWLQDEPRLLEVHRALATGRPASIRAALPSELAAGVRRELLDLTWACSDDGGVQPLSYGAFMMRRCMPVGSEEQLASNRSTSLGQALSLLKGPAMKELVAQLTALRIDGQTVTQPTLFREGDFLSIHNDAEGHRAVAFAWHLYDAWSDGDGGELAFVCPESPGQGQFVPPAANTLTLFRTQGPGFLGTHAVLPVLSRGARRVAITGWFTQRQ